MIFGNGRRTLAATFAPSVRSASLPVGGRRLASAPCKASRKTSPGAGFGLFPDREPAGSAELARQARDRSRLGSLPREDKATARRALRLSGKALGVAGWPAVSTPIGKVSGLRRYCQAAS